jgi:hypothetical protein
MKTVLENVIMLKHFLTLGHRRFILQRLSEWMPSRLKYTSAELIAFVSAPSVWVTQFCRGRGGLTAYSIEEIQQMRDFLNATRRDSDRRSLLMSGRGFTRGASNMAKVVLDMSMSLDGFVAGLSDTVKSPLHDWLSTETLRVNITIFSSSRRKVPKFLMS